MGSHSLSLIPVTPPTMKACISLIVMVGSICCSPVNFLGVPGPQLGLLGYPGYAGYSGLPYTLYGGQPLIYGAETVSPSIYPFRTALDVLNTLPDYPTVARVPSFSSLTTLPNYPAPFPIASSGPTPFVGALPVEKSEDTSGDAVVVDEEDEEDNAKVPGLITVAEEVDSLPAPPLSLFRDPTPPIPAGIVQATQPKFTQILFKNPKVSPGLQQVFNAKVSPVLQEIKEQSSGTISIS